MTMANWACVRCAREIVSHGERQGWTRWQITTAIHKNCECSLLKAQRLARSWKLQDMVDEVTKAADLAGLPRPKLTTQRICHWEAGERPSEEYLDLLCRLFQTRPDRLGYGTDYTPPENEEPPVTVVLPPTLHRVNQNPAQAAGTGRPDFAENEVRRRILVQASVGNRGVLSAQLLDAVDAIRRQGEQVFEETALTAATLDRLEENTSGHASAHLTSPPLAVLCDIVADYMEVQQGLAGRLAADLRQRLCRIAAQMSGLIALVFTDVLRPNQARGWFHMAHQAADENGDRALRAWLRAIEAFVPLFAGDYPRAIALARHAHTLTRQQASPGSVLGYALEARALARLGRNSEALAAIRHADEGYERLDADPGGSSSWLGYPRAAFLHHRGDTLCRLGMGDLARKALGQAVEVYGPNAVRGQAYVEFCLSICDILEGRIADGCKHALGAFVDVPIDQRVAMVRTRAKEVLYAVPPESRNIQAVRDLKEALRDP